MKSNPTITQTITEVKSKGSKIFYLILHKKPLSKEIVEELNRELENRLEKFFVKILKSMESNKPKNPELYIKYMGLKAITKIMENIMNKNYIQMSEEDKKNVEKIYGNGIVDDDDDGKEKKDEKKDEKKENKEKDNLKINK